MVRRIGLPDDEPFLIRDIDGDFTRYGKLYELTPPVIADFAWTNQGSSTLTDTHAFAYLVAAAGSNPNLRLAHKAQPTKPYKIDVLFALASRTAGSQLGGVFWRDSAGGGLVVVQTNNNNTLVISKYSSPTVLSANYQSVALSNYVVNAHFFLRIEDDNTNRIVSISPDGFNWLVAHSVGNTDFITANQVGFLANPASGSIPTSLSLFHWKES